MAVCLLFDRRSERAVRALWDRLERAGVPSLRSHTHGRHMPHVSYAVLRTWDLAAVSAALAGLGPPPVELTFDGVGLFRRGRAWLLAGAAAEFVTGQERVVEAVTETGAELHKHYRPGRWLPHCSVAPRASLAQLPVLAAAIYDVLPLEARLDRIALIDSATGESGRFRLCGDERFSRIPFLIAAVPFVVRNRGYQWGQRRLMVLVCDCSRW